MSAEFLETLQSDIVAILRATPTLADVNVIPEDDGDMNQKIAQGLGTMQTTSGKRGCMAVVLLPEVTAAEANLPGPPMTVECKIQIIEQTLINRAGPHGSFVRSSVGAMHALHALHHHGLATHSLYPPPSKPIEAVPVKAGHLSHMVTLLARYKGLQGPGKPGAVTGQMVGDPEAMELTTATDPAEIYYTTDGKYPTPQCGTLYTAPIENLAAGTVVRAAAYAEGLMPGPLTEIEITA